MATRINASLKPSKNIPKGQAKNRKDIASTDSVSNKKTTSSKAHESRNENTLEPPFKVEQILISEIKLEGSFRSWTGDIIGLSQSIEEVGLLHPVVVDKSGLRLIAGRRRLEACKLLGWNNVPAHVVDLHELAAQAQLDENTLRKSFTTGELFALLKEIRSTRASHRPSFEEKGVNLAPFLRGKTRDIAASLTGKSTGTISKMEKIMQAAEQDPKKFLPIVEKIDSGEMSVDYAFNLVELKRKLSKAKPLPSERFDAIVANPKWSADSEQIFMGDGGMTLSFAELSALDLSTTETSILVVRVPSPKLELGLKFLKSLRFAYQDSSVLLRKAPNSDSIRGGILEYLIIGRKGKPRQRSNGSVFPFIITGESKEEMTVAVYDAVERHSKEGTRLALFDNPHRPGWKVWGDQIEVEVSSSRQK